LRRLRAAAGLLGFRALHLRRFREHRVRTLLSVVGIAAGTTVVVAVTCLYWSMSASIEQATTDIAGQADLEVGALTEGGFDQALLAEVEKVDGVRVAVPMVRSRVTVDGEDALLFGFDDRVGELAGTLTASEQERVERTTEGTLSAAVGPRLVELVGARKGKTLRVQGGGTVQDVEVAEVVRDDRAADLNQGAFVTTGVPVAQAIAAKPGRLDAAFVLLDRGADADAVEQRLTKAVAGRAYVDSPALRAQQAQTATRAFQQGLQISAAMAVIGAAFLVFTTMNMAALERRRELATLRAVGGHQGPLLGGFLAEAAVLGAVAGAIGVALGLVIARSQVDALPAFIVSTFGVRIGFEVAPFAIPVGVAAGLGATLLASWIPARRAVAVAPVEAMRPEGVLETRGEGDRVAWGPTVIGALSIAGGLAAARVLPAGAVGVGLGLMSLGPAALTYGLAGLLSKAVAGVALLFGSPGRLAGASVVRAPRRTWATSGAIAMSVTIVVVVTGFFGNLKWALRENLAAYADADLIVSTSELGSPDPAAVIPETWRTELADLPGVASVGGEQFQFVTLGADRVLLEGVEEGIDEPSLTLLRPAPARRLLNGEGIAVSTRFAELRDLDVGDTLHMPTAVGVQRVEVLDTFETFKWERGVVVLSTSCSRPGSPGPATATCTWSTRTGPRPPRSSGPSAPSSRPAGSRCTCAPAPSRSTSACSSSTRPAPPSTPCGGW
jgi:putative ABC transport system permease protein